MAYYHIDPEVAGGLGAGTVLDVNSHPPIVSKLHYYFDGWLGDSILSNFPCFIITESLMALIQSLALTGVDFDSVEVTTSDEFDELFSDTKLPPFVWMKVHGKAGADDFGIVLSGNLIVSEKALSVLKQEPLNYADIVEYRPMI